jgi:hypothetical protein
MMFTYGNVAQTSRFFESQITDFSQKTLIGRDKTVEVSRAPLTVKIRTSCHALARNQRTSAALLGRSH